MIEILSDPFEPSEYLSAFEKRAAGAGAIVSFLGKVRDGDEGDRVVALELEHFPAMTQKLARQTVEATQTRWAIDHVLVIHRVGRLAPGEPIVLVAVSAAHRRDAFEAADFLMDYLKTDALFWKKEVRQSGVEWIEPRRQDYHDAARWRNKEQ